MFKFNDAGVCINPEILVDIYSEKSTGHYKITLAKDDTHWGFGYNMCGGNSMGTASPTMILHSPEWKSKEYVINVAIAMLYKNANVCLKNPVDVNNTKEFQKLAKKFLKWEKNRKNPQLTLF